ncbi:MAG: hypothetical protein LC775_08625, partial [Acidobacteria bacterium]|nr:hypothetical protein [Acidobacteriota bacterium]
MLTSTLSYSDCKKALEAILSQIGKDTGFAPSTTDMMDLFNRLTSQKGGGGIYVDVPMGSMDDHIPSGARQSRPQPAGGGGLAWLFYPSPGEWQTRQRISVVFLRSVYSDRLGGMERIPFHYVEAAIHEMVHN